MQMLHQTQLNLNNKSIKTNTFLHFRQLGNKIFEITYSAILNNKKRSIQDIETKTKNSHNIKFTVI